MNAKDLSHLHPALHWHMEAARIAGKLIRDERRRMVDNLLDFGVLPHQIFWGWAIDHETGLETEYLFGGVRYRIPAPTYVFEGRDIRIISWKIEPLPGT